MTPCLARALLLVVVAVLPTIAVAEPTATPTLAGTPGGAMLDADGDGEVGPLTDGLLILSYLFGFRDSSLQGGAVDGGAIQGYLSGLGLLLDIDLNGSLGPLTDGLLILRFLLGFTDTALTGGAVADDCTRCEPDEILQYLEDESPPFIKLDTFQAFGPDLAPIDDYTPPPVLQNPFVLLSFEAEDDASPLVAFCLKRTHGFAPPPPPIAGDSCWTSFDAPGVDTTRGTDPPSARVDQLPYRFGFLLGTTRVFLWVRDGWGRVSVNTATLSSDMLPLGYDPGIAPILTNVVAMRSDAPAWPLSDPELTFGPGDSLIIKWHATFPNNPSPGEGSISLFLGTDDQSTVIVQDLPNAPSAGCSLGAPDVDDNPVSTDFTGCYVWSSVTASDYFSIRVVASDEKGLSAVGATMPPLNAAPGGTGIGFLAGNTDPGIGGHASTTYFNTRPSRGTGTPDTAVWPGTLAVSSRGAVYFLDLDHGLVRIDPNTGNSQLLLRIDPSGPSGDGGPIGSATLKAPSRVYIDYQDRLLLYDAPRIRRIEVDSDGNPFTIQTIVGSDVGVFVPPINTGVDPTSFGVFCDQCPIVPLPNGDFYAFTNYYSTGAGFRMLRWDHVSGLVDVIGITGNGMVPWNMDAPVDIPIDDCRMAPVAGQVDAASGTLTSMTIQVSAFANDTSACAGFAEGLTIVGPNGVTLGVPNLAGLPYFNRVQRNVSTGLDGRQYWHSNYTQQVFRYDGTTFSSVLGNGSTATQKCADGTPAPMCPAASTAQFVTPTGELYWMSDGTVRAIDESNLVVTLMGEPHSRAGETAPSLSTRFGAISQVDLWRGCSVPGCFVPWDRLVLADVGNARLREAFVGGNAYSLAGNGWPAYPTDETATETSVYLAPYTAFATDPGNGAIYLYQYLSSGNAIARLSRPLDPGSASGTWSSVIGGQNGTLYYEAAPGTPGADLDLGYTYFSEWFLGGIVDDKLWMNFGVFDFNASYPYRYHRLMTFDIADSYRMDFFADSGSADAGQPFPNGALRSTADIGGPWLYRPLSVYDAGTGPGEERWLHPRDWTVFDHSIAILPIADGPISTLVTVPDFYESFTYRRDAGREVIYYCRSPFPGAAPGPGDGQIYRLDLADLSTVPLPWPVPRLHCRGRSLTWDATRNALVFAYERDGLWGVAEYRNPPLPAP